MSARGTHVNHFLMICFRRLGAACSFDQFLFLQISQILIDVASELLARDWELRGKRVDNVFECPVAIFRFNRLPDLGPPPVQAVANAFLNIQEDTSVSTNCCSDMGRTPQVMPLLLSCTLLAPFERGSGKAVRIRSNSSAVHHGTSGPVMVRMSGGKSVPRIPIGFLSFRQRSEMRLQ